MLWWKLKPILVRKQTRLQNHWRLLPKWRWEKVQAPRRWRDLLHRSRLLRLRRWILVLPQRTVLHRTRVLWLRNGPRWLTHVYLPWYLLIVLPIRLQPRSPSLRIWKWMLRCGTNWRDFWYVLLSGWIHLGPIDNDLHPILSLWGMLWIQLLWPSWLLHAQSLRWSLPQVVLHLCWILHWMAIGLHELVVSRNHDCLSITSKPILIVE